MPVAAIKRREFFTLLGGAAAWPAAARAQQPAPPVVGFLHQGSEQPSNQPMDGFRRGLWEAGFVEGQHVTLQFRWANGEYDRLPALAAELLRAQPSVLAAALLPAARAAKAATTTIPVVFITGSDPVETGLVTSLNRPTENVTGVSLFTVPLIAKRLELLHEVVPGASAVAVLVNPSNPNAESNEQGIEAAAKAMQLRIEFIRASSERDFEAAFATLARQRTGALIVSADGFFAARREHLVALATRMPSRPCIFSASSPPPGDSSATAPDPRTCIAMPVFTPAASSRAPSRPTCPCCSRPDWNWSSTSKPPGRSASPYRRRCSPAPTR
jgi:putative tryptophan/tyrosine transport system substrate-binding protein